MTSSLGSAPGDVCCKEFDIVMRAESRAAATKLQPRGCQQQYVVTMAYDGYGSVSKISQRLDRYMGGKVGFCQG